MTFTPSQTLNMIPSIHTIRYCRSRGQFCHSCTAWVTLLVIMDMGGADPQPSSLLHKAI
ncbi:MAG: hypothetical protein BWX93_00480 [Bacteroidetes bacterium ADurb.Bin139]|nr:MAG: hypothetical protein BWX93_00480 [Bacteroidetes bacterium ADurb.Bin139]